MGDCQSAYTVQPGDTCEGIARKLGTSVHQLYNCNRDSINPGCTNLYPGQVLRY